jgi:hypothetical protein
MDALSSTTGLILKKFHDGEMEFQWKYARAWATIRAHTLKIRQLQANLTKSRQNSTELQATISDLPARLQHSIDLTEVFSRESSCTTNFIRKLIDNLRFACPNRRRHSPHTLSISYFLYSCSAKAHRSLK